MKVTAFVGSARKKHTYAASKKFLQNLQSLGPVKIEIVHLCDYVLKTCKGCKSCMDKGEELCPLKDDRDQIIDKMMNSNGVVFASPNYFFQVSALMKLFLDRLGYFGHRPHFFGKTFTSIVAQGIYGGKDIVKYLNFIGDAMGFNVIKGCHITTLEPMTPKGYALIGKTLEKQANKFYTQLIKNEYPSPSLFKLMVFRWSRTSIRIMLNDSYKDYRHFNETGWFKSDYYYPVKIGFIKRMIARYIEIMAEKKAKKEQGSPS